MSIILLETHQKTVRKIKKRAFIIHVVLVLMLFVSLLFPWISKVKNDLIRASYGVVKHYLVELKGRYALLEILRNKPLTVGQALEIADVVMDETKASKVPVHMVLGVMSLESEFYPDAVSSEGARGLMQVMPDIWNQYVSTEPLKGLKMKHNPALNVMVGIRYLGDLKRQYGDWRKVLKEYGGFKKKSPETYIRVVMANAERYRVQLGDTDGSSGPKFSSQ
jgi:soluble lytic murein transglycosylase-like protein